MIVMITDNPEGEKRKSERRKVDPAASKEVKRGVLRHTIIIATLWFVIGAAAHSWWIQ